MTEPGEIAQRFVGGDRPRLYTCISGAIAIHACNSVGSLDKPTPRRSIHRGRSQSDASSSWPYRRREAACRSSRGGQIRVTGIHIAIPLTRERAIAFRRRRGTDAEELSPAPRLATVERGRRATARNAYVDVHQTLGRVS